MAEHAADVLVRTRDAGAIGTLKTMLTGRDPALPSPGPNNPQQQRYDYLLRTRQATAAEVAAIKQQPPTTTFPKCEAILRVMRHITDPQLAGVKASRPKE